jgi:cytochrome b pre-mRNA-processing protein 3
MLKRLFKPRPSARAGAALYLRAVDQARSQALYSALGAPDTVEGRFELYSLHVYLLLERFKDQGSQAAETAQALFDTYVKNLDDALREMGVGDLSVGKKMRKLGEAFFGRVKSYERAFAALPDRTELEALLGRTVFADQAEAPVASFADYVLRQRAQLAGQALEGLLAADVAWSAA